MTDCIDENVQKFWVQREKINSVLSTSDWQDWVEQGLRLALENRVSALRAAVEAAITEERAQQMMKKRDDEIVQLVEACKSLLELAGWKYMTDDELRTEAFLGNENAPIILSARSVLREAGKL